MRPTEYREMVKLITPLMGKPWKLGSMDAEGGFDCLSFVLYIYQSLGMEIPKEFEGLTLKSYARRWAGKADYQLFERFLMSLGEPIPDWVKLPGDLLIIGGDDGSVFPAIALLNGNAVAMDQRLGAMIFPLKAIKNVKSIRRMI